MERNDKNKSKKTYAEAVANSPRRSNDTPARQDGNKPKEAAGGPSNPSKIKKTDGDEHRNHASCVSDGSGNEVRARFQPFRHPPPASAGPADDDLEKEMEKSSIQPEKGTESSRASCRICNVERPTKSMLQSSECGHYFCKECITNYVNVAILFEARKGILADVRCQCNESLPVNIVLDHLNKDVKPVWLEVHTFWSKHARDLKQKEVAANSPRNRNEPPPRVDGDKDKEPVEAPPISYDISKIKRTEDDEHCSYPSYVSVGSANKAIAGFQSFRHPPPAKVENAPPTPNDGASTSGIFQAEKVLQSVKCGNYYSRERIRDHINNVVKDEAKHQIPANVPCPTEWISMESLPGRSVRCAECLPAQMVLDHLDEDVKYVWLAVHTFFYDQVAQHGESSAQKFHDLKQNEEAKSTGTKCAKCHEKHPTENMLRPFNCKHYFCKRCLMCYTQGLISGLGKKYVSFALGCPVEKCPKNCVPEDIQDILYYRSLSP